MIFHLDLRAQDRGGAVLPGRLTALIPVVNDAEGVLAQAEEVVFLTHGFNVDRPSGIRELRQFAEALTDRAGVARVCVTWPGDSWAGAASYPLEGNDADDSGAAIAAFIERVLPSGTTLCFVSHSLGARVVLSTLMRLDRSRYQVRALCPMAPAVDDFSLAAPELYRAAAERAETVAVLASRSDTVLKYAYPAGDLLQNFLFFWKEAVGLALGYHGARPVSGQQVPDGVFTEQIPDAMGVGHGDYLWNDAPNPKQQRGVAFVDAILQGNRHGW
jgi:hypothetical protein